MFYTLVFIVPFVFGTLALGSPMGLRHNIPGWLNVNIGKLNENQLTYLRKRAFVNLLLAAILTALIGIAFIVYGYADNAIASLICCIIQFAVGMVSINPLLKKANLIKSEINMIIQEHNAVQ